MKTTTVVATKGLAIGALLLVSACGGGGSSSDGGNPPPVVAAQLKQVEIDAEGDSLLYGYTKVSGTATKSINNPPDVLQSLLRAQLGDGVTVQNTSITGAAAFQSVQGIGHYTVSLAQRLTTNSAQIVLTDYAINDSVERSTGAYLNDLTEWVNAVRAAGKTPVLEEPNPTCDAGHPNVGAYVQMMRYVAQTMNVPLIQQYDYVMSLPNWQTMLSADCVHPGDQLYAMKAQREYEALMPLVKSMQ